MYLASTDKVTKGTDASVAALAKLGAKEDNFCLFHTRLASCGGIRDELCHPFMVEGEAGKYTVMHNGHWSDWYRYNDDEKSDTQTMANLVGKYGIGVLGSKTADMSGVWVVYDRDEKACYVIRRSGEFHYQQLNPRTKDSSPVYFHASEVMRTFSQWTKAYGPIRHDVFFEIRPSGRLKERKAIEAVEPKLPQRTYYSSGAGSTSRPSSPAGWYGRYGSYGAWDEDDKLHPDFDKPRSNELAYCYDGDTHQCYCRPSKEKPDETYICISCEQHVDEYGVLPMYDLETAEDWTLYVDACDYYDALERMAKEEKEQEKDGKDGKDDDEPDVEQAVADAAEVEAEIAEVEEVKPSYTERAVQRLAQAQAQEDAAFLAGVSSGKRSHGRYECQYPDCKERTDFGYCVAHTGKSEPAPVSDGKMARVETECKGCGCQLVILSGRQVDAENILCYRCMHPYNPFFAEAF